jgi:DNA-binding CsgD family transcriptional regulator
VPTTTRSRRISAFFAATTAPAPTTSEPPLPELPTRQREILALLADCATNREIADRVFLSEKTVRNNVSMIFAKLHVAHRANAVIRAVVAAVADGAPRREQVTDDLDCRDVTAGALARRRTADADGVDLVALPAGTEAERETPCGHFGERDRNLGRFDR